MKDDNYYQNIVNFIFSGKNHERQKREVRKRFDINESTFHYILILLTNKFLIYEDDTGHVVGMLSDKKINVKIT